MTATATAASTLTREALRARHNVRLVPAEAEGSAFDKLPKGVYGFTYAPATETPVFERQSYHSFEVHKLPDGSGQMLVYFSPDDAAKVRAGAGSVAVTAYPDPYEKATVLVAVPFDWLASSLYKLVREDGNAIPLRLDC